jgi:HK97 family phage major capsid protein
MADIGSATKPILFGDFNYFMIRDVNQTLFFRMQDSNTILNGQVWFVMFMRSDAQTIAASGNAIKHMLMAT